MISGLRRVANETSIFCGVTQRVSVVTDVSGTTYRPQRCPETPVPNYYQSTLRNMPEERRSRS